VLPQFYWGCESASWIGKFLTGNLIWHFRCQNRTVSSHPKEIRGFYASDIPESVHHKIPNARFWSGRHDWSPPHIHTPLAPGGEYGLVLFSKAILKNIFFNTHILNPVLTVFWENKPHLPRAPGYLLDVCLGSERYSTASSKILLDDGSHPFLLRKLLPFRPALRAFQNYSSQ